MMGILLLAVACDEPVPERSAALPTPPLNMEALKKALSYARGETPAEQGWPRTIDYTYRIHDFRTDTFQEEKRVFEIKQRPVRIVPHAVGVAEILWAICPRERLIAFNDLSADPEFCVLAEEIRKRDRIFKTKQTELIIAYEPDLVFTVFYSGAEFKEKLKQAKIPYFDLGYFGTLESICSQILLLGRIIGEEGNAEALVELMDDEDRELRLEDPCGSFRGPGPVLRRGRLRSGKVDRTSTRSARSFVQSTWGRSKASSPGPRSTTRPSSNGIRTSSWCRRGAG